MVDVSGQGRHRAHGRRGGRRARVAAAVVELLRGEGVPKGDALAVARIAGIMGAKRTPDLIPLCHPIAISGVTVDLAVADDAVEITATVRTADRTGVEMEALTAVVGRRRSPCIDMVKAVDKARRHHGRTGASQDRRQDAATGRGRTSRPGDGRSRSSPSPTAPRPASTPTRAARCWSAGLARARASPSTARGWCRTASRSRRRCARRWPPAYDVVADHRRHRHLADGPHPRDDRPGDRPSDPGHRRGDPGRTAARRCRPRRSRAAWPGLAGRTLIVNLPGSTGGVQGRARRAGAAARRTPSTSSRGGDHPARPRTAAAPAPTGEPPERRLARRAPGRRRRAAPDPATGTRQPWQEASRRNRDWLRRWEATVPPAPPGRDGGPRPTYRQMVRYLRGEAAAGRMLPVRRASYEGELVGQLTVGGITWGSMCSGQHRLLGRRGTWPVAASCRPPSRSPSTTASARSGLHRIEVCIRPENGPSRRVVEKLGFREEGVRPRYLHIDGDWRDHLVYALTAEEVPEGLLARWQRVGTRVSRWTSNVRSGKLNLSVRSEIGMLFDKSRACPNAPRTTRQSQKSPRISLIVRHTGRNCCGPSPCARTV